MSNRAKTEKFVLSLVNEIDPSGHNADQYTKIFKKMSDKDFHAYMTGLRAKTMKLVLFRPMYLKNGPTVENNIKVGEKYGLKFFERLCYLGNPNEPDHMSPVESMVLTLPSRKQSQTGAKKVSVPDNNKTIDQLSYQPTGASKGSKVSFPEWQVLNGMGMEYCLQELTQMRGGDRGGFAAYNAMIMRYGNANLKTLSGFTTGVESTKTLKTYLACMHISITL